VYSSQNLGDCKLRELCKTASGTAEDRHRSSADRKKQLAREAIFAGWRPAQDGLRSPAIERAIESADGSNQAGLDFADAIPSQSEQVRRARTRMICRSLRTTVSEKPVQLGAPLPAVDPVPKNATAPLAGNQRSPYNKSVPNWYRF
jgi:hypothetical protein